MNTTEGELPTCVPEDEPEELVVPGLFNPDGTPSSVPTFPNGFMIIWKRMLLEHIKSGRLDSDIDEFKKLKNRGSGSRNGA